ncbi:ArsR/SmtB family transcription factor [Halostella sp. PRR32]|uniref:ArsR/SmtB family transcription factor n=1 Tax=Halostella sp. PRR32 TaxID=3098147 RepID=UPI0034E067FA
MPTDRDQGYMADLLPSTSDATPAEDSEPRVVGVDSDAADDVLAALSSTTARELLAALHEEPATPSELSDAVDTSLQNTQYHLGNLEDAEVVEVADTIYSEKGREMKVYAPADQPLVLFAGQEEETSTLKTALSRLLGGVGIVGAASLALHSIVGETAVAPPTSGGGESDQGGGAVAGDADDAGGGLNGSEDTYTVEGGDSETSVEFTTENDVSINSNGGNETTETVQTTTDAESIQDSVTDADLTTTVANETVEAANDSASSAVDLGTNAGLPPGLLLFVVGTILVTVWVFFRYVDR